MLISALASVQVIERRSLLASALAPGNGFAVAEGHESCVSLSEQFFPNNGIFRGDNHVFPSKKSRFFRRKKNALFGFRAENSHFSKRQRRVCMHQRLRLLVSVLVSVCFSDGEVFGNKCRAKRLLEICDLPARCNFCRVGRSQNSFITKSTRRNSILIRIKSILELGF